jgi:1,4-alpha-glucan branching enzyme
MRKKSSYCALICALIAPVFISAAPEYDSDSRCVTEYTLTTLTKSSSPRELKVVRNSPERNNATVVKKGVLFTYAGRKAKKVLIAGDFTNWKTAGMTRGKNGVWYYFLGEYDKRDSVRYKFKIDGLWISDPKNYDRDDDGNGSFVSLARPSHSDESHQVSFRTLPDGSIEFRHYDARASLVTVAGDFNNWDPEHDMMVRGEDNIWRLKKRLAKGQYRYKLIVDGEWKTDVYNAQSASDSVGGISSLISIK